MGKIKYRIIEKKFKNGEIRYYIQKYKRRFWGLGKPRWVDEIKSYYSDELGICYEELYFRNLKNAQRYCGIDFNPVVEEKIIDV